MVVCCEGVLRWPKRARKLLPGYSEYEEVSDVLFLALNEFAVDPSILHRE